jgi:hypothetical protein
MTRVPMFCAVGGALAALLLSANGASAGPVSIHTSTPTVNVHLPPPKVGGNTSLTSSSLRVIKQPSMIGSTTGGTTGGANGSGAGLPRASDDVIVNFEHGDPKQPYIIGSQYNGNSPAVRTKGKLHR